MAVEHTVGTVTAPFAIGQFAGAGSAPFCGLVLGEHVTRVDEVLPGVTGLNDLLADWVRHVDELTEFADQLASSGRGGELDHWRPMRVLPPVAPRQIFQSGANYRSHVIDLIAARAAEQGEDPETARTVAAEMMDARAANDQPYAFIGLPSALCGAFDDVVLPPTGTQHDWELELAAVIGGPTRRVRGEVALSHVAGYLVVNDVTTRDRVFRPDIPTIGSDWLASKNAPTFLPTGPVVVPATFVDDPQKLQVRLSLNGTVMQDESTSDMIFGVARLIEHVSAVADLLPGDILLTGSPAGNGAHYGRFLTAGDVMEGSITGLGTQVNRCVVTAEAATDGPAR